MGAGVEMITLEDYVGVWKDSPDWNQDCQTAAAFLLAKCEDLEKEMVSNGVVFKVNPKTHTQVSGEVYGGFRPQACPIGAPNSHHKKGEAVDRYDPDKRIQRWCMAHQSRLKAHGIFIEHPDSTPTWCHWQSVPPSSGKTVFQP